MSVPTVVLGVVLVIGSCNAQNPVLPVLTSINPSSAPWLSGSIPVNLTLNGTGFLPTSQVWLHGTDNCQGSGCLIGNTYVSDTQLMTAIYLPPTECSSLLTIRVVNPPPGGGASSWVPFSLYIPAPTITNMLPVSVMAGSNAFTLSVSGTNITWGNPCTITGTHVHWNGVPLPSTMNQSLTQVDALIAASMVSDAGTASITLVNGGGASAPLTLNITNPVPILGSISPQTVLAGGTAFLLTLNGTGFNSQSEVRWNGATAGITITAASSTQITATVSAGLIASAGSANVTVFNPTPGGGTSAAQTINAAPSQCNNSHLSFQMSGSYAGSSVETPPFNIVSALGGSFTFEAWVKVPAAQTYAEWLHQTTNNANCSGPRPISIGHAAGYPYVSLNAHTNHFYYIGTTWIADGNWHHMAVSVQSSAVSVYVDGNQDAPSSVSSGTFAGFDSSPTSPVQIGGSICGSSHTGGIDDVRIWSVARTQQQINTNRFVALPGNEAGLVAMWRFDEGLGTVAVNSAAGTGAALNGTLQGHGGGTPPTWNTNLAQQAPIQPLSGPQPSMILVGSCGAGGASMTLSAYGVPCGGFVGATLVSMTLPAGGLGTGPVFGLLPDLFTIQLALLAQPEAPPFVQPWRFDLGLPSATTAFPYTQWTAPWGPMVILPPGLTIDMVLLVITPSNVLGSNVLRLAL